MNDILRQSIANNDSKYIYISTQLCIEPDFWFETKTVLKSMKQYTLSFLKGL